MTHHARQAAFALLFAATFPAFAQPRAAGPPASAPVPSVDADARCLMMMRNAALSAQQGASFGPDHIGSLETAFAYYGGRLMARHAPDAITPLVAAAIASVPPEGEYQEIAGRCRLAGTRAVTGGAAETDAKAAPDAAAPAPAPTPAPPTATAATADPDALCLRLIRASFLTRMNHIQAGEPVPSGQTRGLIISTAYYTGRLAALHGDAAVDPLVAAADGAGQAHDALEAVGTRCYHDGADAIHALNLAIDAALPAAVQAEAPAGK